jgi:hypothetical protein
MKSLFFVLALLGIVPVTVHAQEEEWYRMMKRVATNACMNNAQKADVASGLTHFRISPTRACECASTETTNAMEASSHYKPLLRLIIRSSEIQAGKSPSFPEEPDQERAFQEFYRIGNQSWQNCMGRMTGR